MFLKMGGQPCFCPQFSCFSFYSHIRYECILAFFLHKNTPSDKKRRSGGVHFFYVVENFRRLYQPTQNIIERIIFKQQTCKHAAIQIFRDSVRRNERQHGKHRIQNQRALNKP